MPKAILIQADDWEGLFIDGVLIEQGHTLNQGYSRVKHFINLAKTHNFDVEELEEVWVQEVDEDYLYAHGGFPKNLNELKGKY